jgi:hypothetical protein
MRGSFVIAGAAAAVAAVLLAGGWLLLGNRGAVEAGAPTSGVAPTTVLSWPPDPSDGSRPPDPYPTVPPAQLKAEHDYSWKVRTGDGGRRLLIGLFESDCSAEEVRLLGEHADRVDVEIRMVAKPPPPHVTIGPDGSYGCFGYGTSDGPHAMIDLAAPLGERAIVIHREH